MSRHDRAGAVVLPVASRSAMLHRPARETHAPCATPRLAEAVVVSGRRCTHAAVRGPSRSTRASTRRHNIASGLRGSLPAPSGAHDACGRCRRGRSHHAYAGQCPYPFGAMPPTCTPNRASFGSTEGINWTVRVGMQQAHRGKPSGVASSHPTQGPLGFATERWW
jgi:hypothetical protein